MKNAIITGVRQGLGIRFFVGVVAVVVILGFALLEPLVKLFRDLKLQSNGYHITLLMTAISSDIFTSFVPIITVLPFSGNYIDEVKSKFARFSMLRSSYSTYLLSRIFVCFLLGGAVILVGVLVTYFFCALLILPIERVDADKSVDFPQFMSNCLTLFLSGGFWALFGMAMSTVMESKYIAYASPFIMYYMLVILYERYFPRAHLIYPKEWMNPSKSWPMEGWGVSVLQLELSALIGMLFYFRGKRRLEQL